MRRGGGEGVSAPRSVSRFLLSNLSERPQGGGVEQSVERQNTHTHASCVVVLMTLFEQ